MVYAMPSKEGFRPQPTTLGQERKPFNEYQADVYARLEVAVEHIQDSDTFRDYLLMQSRFHSYSYKNTLLIMAQRPDATRVARFDNWKAMGRSVKKGEKAIKVFYPMLRKQRNQDGKEEEVLTGFGIGNTFDVSQTDGKPLPDVHIPVLEGDEGGVLFGKLEGLARQQGVRVNHLPPPAPGEHTMGSYDPLTRTIDLHAASQLQVTKTLAHELAHHFAGHKPDQQRQPEQETVAEASAYVVCSHFGLDTGARSFPYVAVWAKEKQVLKDALGTIQKISSQMIRGLEGEGKHPDELAQHPPNG